MANTRPFAYNTGSSISGSNQIGDLAYGTLNPVNGGPNYDYNPGGVKWWMGPDEDGRYIIAKDVPAMNHPTQTPEGDIGSVRFWGTDTQSDTEFLYWFNRLPGRSGMTPISDPSAAYTWLNDNGYFTNYPTTFNEYGTFYTYRGPSSNIEQAEGIIYLPSMNELYVNVDKSTTHATRGPFRIENWTNDVANVISGSTVYYSGSSSGGDGTTWLQSYSNSSKTIQSGYLAIDNDNKFVYNFDNDDRGLLKYDASVSGSPDGARFNDVPTSGRVRITYCESVPWYTSSSYVIATGGGTSSDWQSSMAYCYESDDLGFEGVLRDHTDEISPGFYANVNYTEFATPGPIAYVLLNTTNSKNYYIYKLDRNDGTNFNISIFKGNFNNKYTVSGAHPQPVYVASKNKWYVPYKYQNTVNPGASVYHGIDVIDDSTYSRTSSTFGTQSNSHPSNTVGVKNPQFFLYDSTRDYFWTTSPIDNTIIAISATNFTTQISTSTLGNTVRTSGQSATIIDDKLIIIRPDFGNPIKIFDLSEF
jgi:hypothetical protein